MQNSDKVLIGSSYRGSDFNLCNLCMGKESGELILNVIGIKYGAMRLYFKIPFNSFAGKLKRVALNTVVPVLRGPSNEGPPSLKIPLCEASSSVLPGILSLIKDHLSRKTTFCVVERWFLKAGTTVC